MRSLIVDRAGHKGAVPPSAPQAGVRMPPVPTGSGVTTAASLRFDSTCAAIVATVPSAGGQALTINQPQAAATYCSFRILHTFHHSQQQPNSPATSSFSPISNMFANVKIVVLAAACAAVLVSQTAAKPAYSAKIPNGVAMGKSLGHTSDDYTAFGTMFSKAGLSWSAVCKQNWPGASITVGAALGDPCCKWTEGATPDHVLSAPDAKGSTCAAATTAPAATTAAPAAAAKVTMTTPAPAATTASATPKVTPASTKATGGAKTSLAPTIPGGQLCE